MSSITPTSSFTSDLPASKFPCLLMYFNSDDLASDGLSITCRKSGVVANFSGEVLKDSAGMYVTSARTVSSVTGTMPTPAGGHLLAVCIGKPITNGLTGLSVSFGVASGANYGFSTGGIAWEPSAAQNTAPSASMTATNLPSCQLSYFDLTDTSSPVIRRIVSNVTDATSNQAGTTTDTLGIAIDQLGAGLTFSALSSTTGARCKIAALFEFTNDTGLFPSQVELAIACAEMAKTRQLYAGWFNR